MKTTLAQTAVSKALNGQWEDALDTNLEILKTEPNDVDTLNRLSRCYIELGEIKNSKKATLKVLSIDPENSIAIRCISKLKNITKIDKKISELSSPESFLEESGRTKIVTLMNLGDKSIINCLESGEIVKILSHTHKVSITTNDNKYIGRLPDDTAARIRNLIKSGNKYITIVKSVAPDEIVIFIKEHVNKTNNPSFPPEKLDYVSYTPPELVHKENSIEDLES